MLIVETIARIRRDHLDRGVPIRQIARELKLSRNTVRKAIRGDVVAFGYERTVQPLPKLGPWVGELERVLEANEGKRRRERVSLLRIFEALQGQGYDGGYDAVRRYAASWRWRRSTSGSQAYVPLIFHPGEAYQFDWSHEYAVVRARPRGSRRRTCGCATVGCFWFRFFPGKARRWCSRRTSAASGSSAEYAGAASTTT